MRYFSPPQAVARRPDAGIESGPVTSCRDGGVRSAHPHAKGAGGTACVRPWVSRKKTDPENEVKRDENRREGTASPAGVLYVVATPIGNAGDISARALAVLREADGVLAEDTRHSRRLLAVHGIHARLSPLHDHNERRVAAQVVRRLEKGERLAMMCNAGTPLISDPGLHVVRRVREVGGCVLPVPGPCALVCALSVSGLPTDRFVFEGFLPAKRAARRRRLDELRRETRTLVFYEAPHRVEETLSDLSATFGEGRDAVLAKELTKRHESVRSGTLEELRIWLGSRAEHVRGEFVVLVGGAVEADPSSSPIDARVLLTELMKDLPLRRAVEIACRLTRRDRNLLYRLALEIAGERPAEGAGL